jgi:GT2 family glycosyltransferase
VFPGFYGVSRADVTAVWGESFARECGYYIGAVAYGAARCDIEAQTDNDQWRLVQSLRLHGAVDAWIPGRAKWVWFWLNAWLGRPDPWKRLTEAERDYTLLFVRNRGWFNLDVEPQYSPRPLRPDGFPSIRLSEARLPRIAVVTPSYQQASFLDQTMRSVLDQHGVRIDYVVQDGGSTDGSVEIIRRHAARLVAWESGPDGGQAAAIVRGFSKITIGPDDVMMYLNSDDLLLDGAAQFVAGYFALHPDVDAVYGHRILVDENGQECGRWITPRRACDDIRTVDWVPQETLFWRKRIWDRVGGIDPSFQFAMDWDFLLRLDAAGARIIRLPWFLGAFRVHSQQKTKAQLGAHGVPEMEALRRRTFGRYPTHEVLHLATRRAQCDSALVYAMLKRGWRV